MESESTNPLTGAISALFALFGEMIGAFFLVLPKAIKFVLWVLTAIVILPCVFVAGTIYPMWEKWGSEF